MVTIKDVAKAANVSTATVSRTINGTGRVSPATRAHVKEVIREMNYVPNEMARSFYKKSSNVIGIIIPRLGQYFYHTLLDGIETEAQRHGYKTFLCNSHGSFEREKEYITFLNSYNMAGYVVITHHPHSGLYQNLDTPVVSIDRRISDDIPMISSRNKKGGILVARHFIATKRKHVCSIRGSSKLRDINDRVIGFQEEILPSTVPYTEFNFSTDHDATNDIYEFLRDHPDIDGIFTTSDMHCLMILDALERLGKRVPEDVELVGYGNLNFVDIVSPKLSTIDHNIRGMGRNAIRKLDQIIKGEEYDMEYLTPVRFIHRESTLHVD